MLMLGILIGSVGMIIFCCIWSLYDKYNKRVVEEKMQKAYNRGLEIGRKESKIKEDEA